MVLCLPSHKMGIKLELDFSMIARLGMYVSVVQRQLHSCCIHISANVNVMDRGPSNRLTPNRKSDQPMSMQDAHLHATHR